MEIPASIPGSDPGSDPNKKLAALGATPAATPAQTGVNPGGQGYNSGQVNPATSAAAAAPTTPTSGGGAFPMLTGGAPAKPIDPNSWLGKTTLGALPAPAPVSAPVQIASSIPTVGAASPVAASPAAASPVASSTAPATAAPGSTTANPGGTTNGYNPLTSGAIGATPLGPALNGITGGLLQTQQADLSGVHAAQNADFGQAQNFAQERYDYTPGAAPSQTGVTLNTGQADQTRTQQQQALDALGDAAAGRVPSAAELQLRQQSAKDQAATLGAARALGGRSAGGVARAATLANAGTAAQTNLDAAQTRAAEQAAARQQQITALTGVRSQDLSTADTQAQLDQARNANNLQAQTTADAQAEAQRQALIQAQLTAMGQGTTAAGAGATASAANAASQNSAKGGIVKTIGSAVGL